MATPTATAKRQERAINAMMDACEALGIAAPASTARDPQVKIADLLEQFAAILAELAARHPAPESDATPARRKKTT